MLVPTYFMFWHKWLVYLRQGRALYARRIQEGMRKRAEVKDAIMATGVVRNTHEPFHPKKNPRRLVDSHQAEVIAYKITQREGKWAGGRPTR